MARDVPWPLPFIGNEAARRFLLGSYQADRLAHAYLFVGPAQVGRRTLALWLARLVNCATPLSSGPCERCSTCRRIMRGSHPDVSIIAPLASDRGEVKRGIVIDQVREVVEHLAPLRPYEASTKVFILRSADTMTEAAANTLLKTLEEPPAHTLLVLTASDSARLLSTIVSRCQLVALRPVPTPLLAQALTRLWRAGTERDPEEQAELLARLAAGRPGWAIEAVQRSDYQERRQHLLDETLRLLAAGPHERLAAVAAIRSSAAVAERLDHWLSWWRDLLLARVGCTRGIANWDRRAVLADIAAQLEPAQIAAFLRRVEETRTEIAQNANVRLALDVLLLDMPRIATT